MRKRSSLLTLLAFLFAISISPCSARAAEQSPDTLISPEKEKPIQDLGVMVVTATKTASPAKIDEVNKETFEARGDLNVSDALDMVPGVTIGTGNKNELDVKIRGMGTRQILVLFDGRPVNMPYYGKVDLSTIPLDDIEKIVVYKGAPTLLYGVNGSAGIINIITRSPLREPGWKVKAIGSYGLRETWSAQVDAAFRWSKLYTQINAFKHAADGYPLSDDFVETKVEDGGIRTNSDYDRLNITGKIGYNFTPETEAAISVGYYQAENGIPPDIYWSPPQYRRFVDWKRWFVDGTGRIALWKDASVTLKLFYDKFDNEMIEYFDPDFNFINWDSFHHHWDAGGIALFNVPIGNHDINLGIHGKQELASTEGFVGEPKKNYDMYTVSSSLEYTYTIVPVPLSISAGGAFSTVGAGGDDKLAGGYDKNSWDGRVGITYTFLPNGRVYTGTGIYSRYPTLRELSSDPDGNPLLEQERSWKSEIGCSYDLFRLIEADVAFFNEQYTDMIFRWRLSNNEYMYVNISDAWSRGLEAGIQVFSRRRGLKCNADYTLAVTRDENTDKPIPFIPNHMFHFNVMQKLFGVTAHAGCRWAVNRSNFSGIIMDDYFVMKSKIMYTWKWISASCMVDNIFDANYSTEDANFPMAGRTFRLDLGVALQKNFTKQNSIQ